MCVYNCMFKLPMLTAYVTAASVYVILPVQLYDARSWSWVADMLIKHFDIGKVFRLLEKCCKICQQSIRQNLQICVRAKQETAGDKSEMLSMNLLQGIHLRNFKIYSSHSWARLYSQQAKVYSCTFWLAAWAQVTWAFYLTHTVLYNSFICVPLGCSLWHR